MLIEKNDGWGSGFLLFICLDNSTDECLVICMNDDLNDFPF